LTPQTDHCLLTENLGKRFENGQKSVQAFTDINLSIRRGEFVCLVGPSGCGKTTLLRCMAGIETPTTGRVEIVADPKPNTSRLAMVFQQHWLYPWMTVEENLRFVLQASPIDAVLHADIIDRFINRVGLGLFRKFYPYQLSGGMNQRLSLIRAFCIHPQMLLMDEPFVFLDYQNRMMLQKLLLELWADEKQTIVFVTHNINEAIALGDRVLLMTASPGTIKREMVSEFPRPRDVVDLRRDPHYEEMVVDITNDLREEIEIAQRKMESEWLKSKPKKRA